MQIGTPRLRQKKARKDGERKVEDGRWKVEGWKGGKEHPELRGEISLLHFIRQMKKREDGVEILESPR